MWKESIQSITTVYNALSDELSRDIFFNRLQYSVSNDFTFINKMVKNDVTGLECAYTQVEILKLKEVLKTFKNKKKIIIYGAGVIGKLILNMLRELDIQIECFSDMNPDLQFLGVDAMKVISPEVLKNSYAGKAIVILSIWKTLQKEVRENLLSNGFNTEELIDGIQFFKMASLIHEMYFEPDIIKFSKDEIFLDVGSFDFDTSSRLLSCCNTVKKIYAFEPDESNIKKCEMAIKLCDFDNVVLIKAGAWSSSKILRFSGCGGPGSSITEHGYISVPVVSIDDVINECVTYIKMDIEGSELEALYGAKKTILKYKPKLAISIYHKPEDLLEIPLFIKELVPDYELYLRHYTNMPMDTVLYCICKEYSH